jgi:CheY-like chemotaxis protein
MGIELSPHPSEEELRREYERIGSQLGPRAIEDLIDLPVLSDPSSLATLDVLAKLAVPAHATDNNLHGLVNCRAVSLSIERAEAFSSAEAFLASDVVSETSCLLLDIAMPGMSGTDLQQELTDRRQQIPIVFITGSGDRTVRPRLIARGAVDCVFNPFNEATLLDAVNAALRMR